MENKATLIIDGNYFLFKSLHAIKTFDEKNPLYTDDNLKESKNKLYKRITTDISKDISGFSSVIENVIITIDSPSWRSCIQSNYKGIGKDLDYKGNRDKSSDVSWSDIYKDFDNLLTYFKEHTKANIIKLDGCEGDDIIAACSQYYNANGKNVIIYSGDNDLSQLLTHNDESFTIYYRHYDKSVLLSKGTAKYIKTVKTPFRDNLVKLINKNSYSLKVSDPTEVLFDKILTGDKGDNVFSIIVDKRIIKSGKNIGGTKEYKVSNTVLKKVKEEILFSEMNSLDFYNDSIVSKICKSVNRNFKTHNEISDSDVINNFKLNRDLVMLHKNTIPHSIYECIIDELDKCIGTITEVMYYKSPTILLEGNPHYDGEDDLGNSSSFFRYIDGL